jgi:putative FmdB family regulatory protein
MNYSYRCPECGVFTIEQSMKDDPISSCPSCGQPVKRIIGKNINVLYRTTGFYCTDKGGSCSDSSSSSEASAGSACAGCEHHEAHSNL